MELKHEANFQLIDYIILLIVPYGIETTLADIAIRRYGSF